MEEKQERDAAKLGKKIFVWVVSFAVATGLSLFLVYFPLETDLATYSMKYFVVTVISFAAFFAIWLDLLLGAEVLPD